MKNYHSAALSVVALATITGEADARTVRVEVPWSGVAPTNVTVSVPGGDQPLTRAAGRSAFVGEISVSNPQHGTITVQYGTYFYPFAIRLNPRIQKVVLPIGHETQRACASQRVRRVESPSNNLPEAIERAVEAGELLSIQGPNACMHDRIHDLRFHAIRAAYVQAIAMNRYSDGMILVRGETEEDYRKAAREKNIPVDLQIESDQQREGIQEIRRLVASASKAIDSRNYQQAIDINDYMESRIDSSEAVKNFYASQGVTKADLEAKNIDLERGLDPRNQVLMAGERGLR